LAIAIATPATAQDKSSEAPGKSAAPAATQGTKLETLPPKGFEDLDNEVTTEFDLTFQERRIGAFSATFKNGQITFADPAKIAAALGPIVDTAAVTAFLARPLPANEQFRCRPGQSPNVGCGLLPGGTSGVIVNVEAFDISLFLAREYLISTVAAPRLLGPPTSGPSLIQTVRLSAASVGQAGFSYGGTFDTLASVGRTALIAQTTLSDLDGFRAQEIYAQRVWSDRRAAAGLLQDYQSLTLTNYRMLGAEFGSSYGTMVDAENDTATPIDVLLPRRAQVEIYRDNVLVASGRYEAGLQLLDTRTLPDGSYTVRIIARDGGQVLLDQTRSFSKLANLVPAGKTAFRLRVGERVEDNFLQSSLTADDPGFLPRTTGELIASASAQRRLGRSIAAGLTVTSFGSRIFTEGSLELFRGKISGLAAVGGGSDGTYSALVSGTVQFSKVSFYLSGRTTHTNDDRLQTDVLDNRYQPFFRSEDTIFGSIQSQVFGGSLGFNGSYTRSYLLPDRYAAGVQYTRSMRLPFVGGALVTASATKSDFDTRVGITISFFKRIDRKTNASFTGGAQYVTDAEPGGGRSGFSPVAEAVVTHNERMGSADLTGQAGASTDADSDRIFAQLRGESPYGSADATAQLQSRAFGGNDVSYLFNGQTGFAFGGGAVKLGLRDPADSMVLVDLRNLKSNGKAPPNDGDGEPAPGDSNVISTGPTVAEGGYRVTVDGKASDYVKPGTRTAVGLPAFKGYTVGLRPEGAPQFDLNVTQRDVTLYPGNVVRLRFEAQRVISLFGQALDASGAPLGGARVEAGSDFAVADDRGYFTITAPLAASITIKTPSGEPCIARPISGLVNTRDPSLIYRFGKIRCAAGGGIPEKAAPAKAEPSRPIPTKSVPSIKSTATAPPALQPVASNIAMLVGDRQGQLWNSAADKLATARANIEMLSGPKA
jgi:hypothetical protein